MQAWFRKLSNKLWLKLVYRNLFSNAIKYGGNECAISFGFEDHGSYYKLNVFNTGQPIPEDQRESLFLKFTRIEQKEQEVGKGMGLGLSITYGIVRDYDGTIQVESSEEGGTTFKLTFPCARD